MICYLVRHGQDDDTVRGGWGNSELTETGIEQVNALSTAWQDFCIEIKKNDDNVILVTHAGVIEIILNIVNHEEYTNKVNKYTTEPAKLIKVEI